MKRLLLHACCAPCGAYSHEYLTEQGYDVTYYFYNPNIFPKEEYERRLNELLRYCGDKNIPIIVEEADFESWDTAVKGHEDAPERGSRCKICYGMRLKKTAEKAKEMGFDCFTTTLSISPHKSYEMIKEISEELSRETGVEYTDVNLKKKDGYKKSVALSQKYGFYRQNYCGCKYSRFLEKKQNLL